MVEDKKQQSKQIYIFQNTLYPIVKIGISDNPSKRKSTVENASGFPLTLVYESKPVLNPVTVERLIHKRLDEYRQRGEWFTIDTESAIKEIKQIINLSQEGEYKDLSREFVLKSECVQVIDYPISNYKTFVSDNDYKFQEQEEFIYTDSNYNYYILYQQGELQRTIQFCNLKLAKNFKKVHFERLLLMK